MVCFLAWSAGVFLIFRPCLQWETRYTRTSQMALRCAKLGPFSSLQTRTEIKPIFAYFLVISSLLLRLIILAPASRKIWDFGCSFFGSGFRSWSDNGMANPEEETQKDDGSRVVMEFQRFHASHGSTQYLSLVVLNSPGFPGLRGDRSHSQWMTSTQLLLQIWYYPATCANCWTSASTSTICKVGKAEERERGQTAKLYCIGMYVHVC